MIQLALVRHATAEAAAAAQSDHERPLSPRGQREAPEAARRTLRSGVRPATVLTSTAVRARETAAAFAEAMGAEIVAVEALYVAEAEDVLGAAREHGAQELVLVAHDPALSELATSLAGREVRMVPSAVAVFTWNDGDWDAVGSLPPDDVALLLPA